MIRTVSGVFWSVIWMASFLIPMSVYPQGESPVSEDLHRLLRNRQDRIESDLRSGTASEWEGFYTYGEHHPDVFAWSRKSGFLAYGSDHMFFPTRLNYGTVRLENGVLQLESERDKADDNFENVASELALVKWGEQHFLIPTDSFEFFASVVHSESQADLLSFYLKTDDLEKARSGYPDLPEKYGFIMTMQAIEAKVGIVMETAVDDRATRVSLNKGSIDHVSRNMRFYYSDGCVDVLLLVETVNPKTSVARAIGFAEGHFNYDGKHRRCAPSDEFKIRKGMKFSSKAKGFFKFPVG